MTTDRPYVLAGALGMLLAASSALPAAEPTGTATIKGKVVFEGKPPKMKKIKMGADPTCQQMHPQAIRAQTVVVNEDGTLQNVFVYVKSGLGKRRFKAPDKPVVIDQKGCMYNPHVFGMMVKQPLKIRNSDNTLHNIHAIPKKNKEFNFGQPKKGMEATKTFTKKEVMVRFKCDVHPWMRAYVGVLDHPFFSVTGKKGTFEIKGLPAGEYEIAAWHEKYKTKSQKVKVKDNETKEIKFVFSRKKKSKKK